ncbi:myeloid cell surface antigen CD33-like [Salvelinus alpinus]|uniref:myeloid cell surface antigen CD33-like n=1 Tax=Salvelinus alpinus TaxID=8036 RepID=UPI0039FBB625
MVSSNNAQKGQEVILTCSTTCTLSDNPTYIWYKNGQHLDEPTSMQYSVKIYYSDSYSCAVKGYEALRSPAVCFLGQNCFNVTYTNQSICAVKGSTVELPCTYQHPSNHVVSEPNWYIQEKYNEAPKILSSVPEYAGRAEYLGTKEKDCTLRITDLRERDSAEYKFRFKTQYAEWGYSFPGTTLTVTGLQMKVTPATEKGILTLTCSTTCTLTENPTYIWYKNGQLLTNPSTQDNYLIQDPVSSEDAGRYSCTVEGYNNLHSPVLSVGEQSSLKEAAVGIIVVVLVLILCLSGFMWFRTKPSISTYDTRDRVDTAENGQGDSSPVYDNISGMAMNPTAAQTADPYDQDDVHYASVHHKNQEVPLYFTVQLLQPQKQDEDVQYAAVKFNHPSATQ